MTTVIGLFERPDDAGRALGDLVASGTPRDAVSVLTRGAVADEAPREPLAEHDAEKGLLVGGLAGLMLGLADLSLPGIGAELINAININDLPLVEGIVVVFALITVAGNLLADLLYTVLDPRIRYGRAAS